MIRFWRSAAIVLTVGAIGVSGVGAAKKVPGPENAGGARFPDRVGVFVRKGKIKTDDGGDPYAGYWAGSLVYATVYCYKTRGHTIGREYADCRDYVKVFTPAARLVSDSTITISSRGQSHNGRRAIFYTKSPIGGASEKAKTQLLIFQQGDRFLKFRITYSSTHAKVVEEEIDTFVRAFPWPGG